jgi:hypothetical protein
MNEKSSAVIPLPVLTALLRQTEHVAPASPFGPFQDLESDGDVGNYQEKLVSAGVLKPDELKLEGEFQAAFDIATNPEFRIEVTHVETRRKRHSVFNAAGGKLVSVAFDYHDHAFLSTPRSVSEVVDKLIPEIGPATDDVPPPKIMDLRLLSLVHAWLAKGMSAANAENVVSLDRKEILASIRTLAPGKEQDVLSVLQSSEFLVSVGDAFAFHEKVATWLPYLGCASRMELSVAKIQDGQPPHKLAALKCLFLGEAGDRALLWPLRNEHAEFQLSRPDRAAATRLLHAFLDPQMCA